MTAKTNNKTSGREKPAPQSRAKRAGTTAQRLSSSNSRVVQNKQPDTVAEDITREPVNEPEISLQGLKIVTPAELPEAEEITPNQTAKHTNHPSLSNGARIRQNRSYQRIQKIKSKKLTVPASNEMGYKKLFTKFEEAFLAQDTSLIGECLSPAFRWGMPNGDMIFGKKEALEEMERRFAMPNGPKFSKTIWRFEGETVLQNYDVEYLGPDGVWRKSRGFDLYEIGKGLITLKDAFWKMIP